MPQLPFGIKTDDFYVALIGVLAFLCVWGVGNSFTRRNVTVRIKAIQERRQVLQSTATGAKKRVRPETGVNFMRAVVMKLQLIKKNRIGKTESSLVEAGFRSRDAIIVLAFFNLVLPIALGVVGIIAVKLNIFTSQKWHMFNYIWPVLGAYIGLKLPGLYIGHVRKKRYYSIQKSLPDVLDLMTICAEVGLSLVSMLDRVARELAIVYPPTAEELAMTAIEIGFLPDRNQALSNFAKRCTLPEVRGIVSVLIQTEKYGTPIAQALRVLSSEFRQARMLRAEQKASRLPALMTIPMITCILPVLFIVIIAPSVIKLLDTTSH